MNKDWNFIGGECIISPSVKMGRFNDVGNKVIIDEKTQIGSHNTIGTGVKIGKNCQIGNNVTLAEGVVLPDETIVGNNVTIENTVQIGCGNIIHHNCVLRGATQIGDNNEFLPNSIIGYWPKDIGDIHFEGRLEIGSHCFFGEGTVINVGEATDKGDLTYIGDHVYSMDMVTINHNDQIARGEIPLNPKREFTTILSSKVSLAGHVEVGTGTNMGMQSVAHQFSVIGAGAMIGMNASVTKNVVPFAKVIGTKVTGINKRPLAENLDFGTYDDEVLETVADMVEAACYRGSSKIDYALEKLERYRGKGQWNERARKVIIEFLEADQNGRKLMGWKK